MSPGRFFIVENYFGYPGIFAVEMFHLVDKRFTKLFYPICECYKGVVSIISFLA